jgi:site-specific DNA-methyltransferase (adenine-specific)
MDAQSGVSVSKSGGVAGWQDKYVGGRYTQIPRTGYDDTGSAARFFPTFYYTAKASSAERNQGTLRNHHPTVKPVALMRWLVRLVTPPGGTVLDPFLGSGTTAVAAVLEGYDWIGCEITADYVPIIESRVAAAEARGHQPDLFSEAP